MRFIVAVLAALSLSQVYSQGIDSPVTRLVPVAKTQTGFSNRVAVQQAWQITKAATHHRAIARVQTSGGAGTGCLIAHDGKGAWCITNHHVVSMGWTGNGFVTRTFKTATVATPFGAEQFTVVYSDPKADIALLHSSTATASVAIPLCDSEPPVGAMLELGGYGGPTNQLRTFAARRISSRYALSADAPVVSGDSGGPMLYRGSLCGVLWGAPSAAGNRGSIEGWSKTYPATSNVTAASLRDVCQQVFTQYGCTPRTCPPVSQPGAPVAQPAPIQPKCDCPTPVTGKDGSDGAVGPQGPPGKDAVIDYDVLAAEVAKRLPPIYPQWIDKDGNVIDELRSGVRLGQTLPLRAEVILDASTKQK